MHCYNQSYFFPTSQSEEQLAFYGVDWDGPAPSAQWDGPIEDEVLAVEVPNIPTVLQASDLTQLSCTVNPLQESDDSGVDLYLEALRFIYSCIET